MVPLSMQALLCPSPTVQPLRRRNGNSMPHVDSKYLVEDTFCRHRGARTRQLCMRRYPSELGLCAPLSVWLLINDHCIWLPGSPVLPFNLRLTSLSLSLSLRYWPGGATPSMVWVCLICPQPLPIAVVHCWSAATSFGLETCQADIIQPSFCRYPCAIRRSTSPCRT